MDTEDFALSYDDVLLIPRYSELDTRANADTSVNFCGWKFALPVLPANMQSVINIDLAGYFSQQDYFYIYHRFGTSAAKTDTLSFVVKANLEKWKLISISTGVNEDTALILDVISKTGQRIDFITIDVAHGHHKKVKERIALIKKLLPKAKIIAGNVASPEAVQDLASWGADAAKVGIGQGSICTTRFQTGFSVPMFSCVGTCASSNTPDSYYIVKDTDKKTKVSPYAGLPLIADGGLKYPGDIAKALVAGATMVMSGALFASCIDSPAEIKDGKKQYFGSTSFEAKKVNKNIEGKLLEISSGCTIIERLDEIKQALQSSISYSGGTNLAEFKNVDYVVIK